MKILFLAANPKGTTDLQLREEVNRIDNSLKKAGVADKFQLIHKWAVDATTLRRSLLDEKPDVVHFSGHGTGADGLVLEGQDGKPRPATGDALAQLFKIVNEQRPVCCVLLNACYAEEQAKAIFQHIDNVIGMRREMKDDAAIAFATGFYDGLGRRLSISQSFQLGKIAIQFELSSFSRVTRKAVIELEQAKESLEPIPDHLIPILYSRETDIVTSASIKTNILSEALKEDNLDKEEALKKYRKYIQRFLDDGVLTSTEAFQLSTHATALKLTQEEATRVLEEEQKQQTTSTNRQLRLGISNTKNYLLAFLGLLIISAGGFLVHRQTTTAEYAHLQTLLEKKDWKRADDETARILLEKAGRQQEKSLRVEDFKEIPCPDISNIDNLWTKYSKKHFGFSAQKRIWLSSDVNSDLSKFVDRVGWGERKADGSFIYWLMDGQTFDLSMPAGKLPWAPTYYGGTNKTRSSYMSRLNTCLP